MPAATITVRELKNKDTGIDLSIPTYQEVPGRLGSVFEYNVVVVSRLSYFKSPKHKETDNVQFTIQKKFSEFEDLHSKMTAKFSGTMFPPLPKKALIVNEATAKERRGGLENFLKFLSRTPKLSTSSLLLEFLGVNAVKAGKFRRLEVVEGMDEEDEEEESVRKTEDQGEQENVKEPDTGSKMNLFDEEQEEDTDLFVEGDMDRGDTDISAEIKTTAVTQSTRGETKLFEDIDLGGGIVAEDENQLLFVISETGPADQSKQRKNKPNLFEEEGEDNSDLFQIDDDLEKFLSLDLKSKFPVTDKDSPVHKSQDSLVNVSEEAHSPNIPKPAPRAKPPISRKPTSLDTVTQDTETNLTKPETATQDTQTIAPPKPIPRQKPPVSRKPKVEQKPVLPPKPGNKIKETLDAKNKSEMKGDYPNEITQDDILKYIQDNAADNSDDLDLFS
ncbi:hypothetical protein ACJMK2_004627 [Sinanodonta woodiana]|uniref:PX domain-containing protein n=1 Tax=Sinanodonta woodiana TaxID=1069815 RepID=A0ABD3Y1V2_SINWO